MITKEELQRILEGIVKVERFKKEFSNGYGRSYPVIKEDLEKAERALNEVLKATISDFE